VRSVIACGVAGLLSVGTVQVLSGQGAATPARFLVGASIGYFIVGGQDLSAVEDAFGLEAYLGYRPSSRVSLNLGGHFSRHGDLSIWPWDVFGAFVEPRLHLRGFLPFGELRGPAAATTSPPGRESAGGGSPARCGDGARHPHWRGVPNSSVVRHLWSKPALLAKRRTRLS
jgi:hypothetical protein